MTKEEYYRKRIEALKKRNKELKEEKKKQRQSSPLMTEQKEI